MKVNQINIVTNAALPFNRVCTMTMSDVSQLVIYGHHHKEMSNVLPQTIISTIMSISVL